MKVYFSGRRLGLLLLDTLMIICVNTCIWLVSRGSVDTIVINGEYTFVKAAVLWGCIIASRYFFSVYNSIWRYANVKTYLKIVTADLTGGSLFYLFGLFVNQFSLGFAVSVISTFGILLLALVSRFFYQFIYAYTGTAADARFIRSLITGENNTSDYKINVAIVGAGNVGASLAEELVRNPKAKYRPYCFVDTDKAKVGSEMNGIHIYEEDENIVEALKGMPVQEIIIALPDATSADRERLFRLYRQTNRVVKIYDYPLNKGNDTLEDSRKRTLREFGIEDLLFRNPIQMRSSEAGAFYKGKRILVTGGGGSIGSELCRQIARLQPEMLIILDIYENNAYDIQQELISRYGVRNPETGTGLDLKTVIASVRDRDRLEEIFREFRPQIVFHAAAHKHVPLMEDSGCEAIKNNVFGTYYVADMAEKYEAEKFVLISTDKAVNPTNIMGASKRLCEMVIQCRRDSKTDFSAVRFGNVLGSNGSVIPLFKKQIAAGGPVTITDKRIIRYFMTIPEAVGLVMETCCMAGSGELFVLDMGKPVKILELAENMIRLSGLKPYEDIDIVEIGLRPGEKLYEELLMKSEELDKTENDMIFIERDHFLSREAVDASLQRLWRAVAFTGSEADVRGHREALLEAIRETVPTYHDPETVNREAAESEEMQKAQADSLPAM